MRLAVNLGYWGAGNDKDNLAVAREADRIGKPVLWGEFGWLDKATRNTVYKDLDRPVRPRGR